MLMLMSVRIHERQSGKTHNIRCVRGYYNKEIGKKRTFFLSSPFPFLSYSYWCCYYSIMHVEPRRPKVWKTSALSYVNRWYLVTFKQARKSIDHSFFSQRLYSMYNIIKIIFQSYKETISCKTAKNIPATIIQIERNDIYI